ncbi:alpha/beta fold hydrolase [Ancylobacter defluvii]|uniref:Lysophospholipase n=1 Tax=Ancylobacter defluvii TaxID=1282440 RepID=A0A9W6N8Z8_9HYPH|nr:alpha/beta hydrolase [Ancylobacter defluvii]MBS7587255.1 alpha/beta hydrolase [Ancylobacter defluvii]GLK81942.1 lysophospholipase [Ancylobacter defluvii]
MNLFSTPDNPVPDSAESGMLRTSDGVSLRYAYWRAAARARGTVCVFPGRTEKIEKYFETAEDLRGRGFSVAVLDWRGQGGSQRLLRNPMKGHVGAFSEYQLDLEAFMRDIVLPNCPAPYYALAHSMGAAILLESARLDKRWFNRMVLSTPMLDLAMVRHERAARRTARVLNAAGLSRVYVPHNGRLRAGELIFEGNRLTSDPVRFARNLAISVEHPVLDVGPPTIGWVKSAFDQMDRLTDPATARVIRQPLLMVGAGADKVVSTPAIERLGSRLIAGAHIVLPGARHELLQERDEFRQPFLAAFDAFIPGSAAAAA